MFLIFEDPFLYFGIAVWPIAYFLKTGWPLTKLLHREPFNVVDYFKNLNGFHVPFAIPILSFNGFSWQRNYYVDMTVKQWNLNWNLYKICSMLFFAAFIYVMGFQTDFNQNIVMLRTQNYTDVVGTGHWLIWLAAFIVYARFGVPFDFVKGIYAMAFFGGLHEGMWYITYIVDVAGIQSLYINSPFLILISGMIFGFLLLFRKQTHLSWTRISLIVFGMAMFYFMWYFAGFHTTLDIMTGRTAFYYNIDVNMIENLSWVMPALLFL